MILCEKTLYLPVNPLAQHFVKRVGSLYSYATQFLHARTLFVANSLNSRLGINGCMFLSILLSNYYGTDACARIMASIISVLC